jgi:hypothetical protein
MPAGILEMNVFTAMGGSVVLAKGTVALNVEGAGAMPIGQNVRKGVTIAERGSVITAR